MAGIWDMCVFFNVCIQNVGLYEITRLIAILVDALSDEKPQNCLLSVSMGYQNTWASACLCALKTTKQEVKPKIQLMAVLGSIYLKFETWSSGMCNRHYGPYMEIIFIYFGMTLTVLGM